MQSIKNSLLETTVNIITGLLISFLIQLWIYPLLGIKISINQNLITTAVFFIASFLRGFIIRRLFNRMKN